ncbi:MAG: hypothetical protein KDJ80_04800 [Nitratireductor sp.]|nr:hypothetical protein [Nitratireductor sp.]
MQIQILPGALALFIAVGGLAAGAQPQSAALNTFEEGSVSREEGLASWQVFYEVASHPRCANCHVGDDNLPMWSGASFGAPRRHGMNIDAGVSRIGAETLPCSTCHIAVKTFDPAINATPHMPPKTALAWQLAPVEMEWFGKSSAEICAQVQEPARTGGRDVRAVAEHLAEDVAHGGFIQWAWAPGGGREPAPHSLQEAMDALMKWQAAGTPCP